MCWGQVKLGAMLKQTFLRKHNLWYLLSLLVVFLDQGSKFWATLALKEEGQSLSFIAYFNFTLLHNEGAAFSFLSDAGGWQRFFLIAASTLVSGFLVVWLYRLEQRMHWSALGLALILGGALGNLWDRITLGYVVDFVDWFYVADGHCIPLFYRSFNNGLNTCHWPAFNIADASILAGAVCIVLSMLVEHEGDHG
jgi:signal peptidase II